MPLPVYIYIEQSSIYFLHVVHSGVYQCRAYLTIAHALEQGNSLQGSDPWLTSCWFSYVTLWWLLLHNRCVYACPLLKISNSPFCVIPFHSCLFVLVFESFSLDSKQIFFLQFCNFMLSNLIVQRIVHGESGDMEFFYQPAVRYVSSGRNDFRHLASHVET